MVANWVYCPHCGGTLTQYDDDTHGKCNDCDQIWHKTPPPSTVALCIRNNTLLLTKRAIDPHKGEWDFPGGFIKPGESAEDTMGREIEEELGVRPTKMTLASTSSNPSYQYLNESLKPLDIVFLVDLPDVDLHPADDVAETKWFPLNEPLPTLAFGHMKQVIEEFVYRR